MGELIKIEDWQRPIRIGVAEPGKFTVQGEPVVIAPKIVSLRCLECGKTLASIDAKMDFTDLPPNLHALFVNMLMQTGEHSDCPKTLKKPKLVHSSKEKPTKWAKFIGWLRRLVALRRSVVR